MWRGGVPSGGVCRFRISRRSLPSRMTAAAADVCGASSGCCLLAISAIAWWRFRRMKRCLAIFFNIAFSGAKGLGGHSFGNIFLTALTHVTGDFPEAVRLSGQVLAIRGRIFPSTAQNVTLEAELEDGHNRARRNENLALYSARSIASG